jgi:hypothetical protein
MNRYTFLYVMEKIAKIALIVLGAITVTQAHGICASVGRTVLIVG